MTLTITISRTTAAGGPTPLVLSGSDDSTELGVTQYQPPAIQQRVQYMTDSPDVHGSEAISSSYQQSILGFTWVPDRADDEADVQAAQLELEAALGQFAYTVITEVGNAPAQTWAADSGSMQLAAGGRSTQDLVHHNPEFSVTIPVYPIPEA